MAEISLKLHGGKNNLSVVLRLIHVDTRQKKMFEMKATDLTMLCYIL
jgi:hypothetical protein